MKTATLLIETKDSALGPQCVYCSLSTGDILIGMFNTNTLTGKVTRYNQAGKVTQTIKHDNTGKKLYSGPKYITENNNGDVVVSDYNYVSPPFSGAVVVTERGGRHRFSYTGYQLGSVLEPYGICTDALSHILVCDYLTNTVHVLNKNGEFLSHLLSKSQNIGRQWSLSYNGINNDHRLWVGSYKKLCVYKYITKCEAHQVIKVYSCSGGMDIHEVFRKYIQMDSFHRYVLEAISYY